MFVNKTIEELINENGHVFDYDLYGWYGDTDEDALLLWSGTVRSEYDWIYDMRAMDINHEKKTVYLAGLNPGE